ncbi:MAG: NADPH:quinone reductase-like Zn-dependent oxidoreductase [Gammaproteobacteria bacterium]|jgi:NADPH:quinone reductase-like Zn-dependent oxidoreductase
MYFEIVRLGGSTRDALRPVLRSKTRARSIFPASGDFLEMGAPGSWFITRPAFSDYLTPRSALLSAVDGLFEALRQGIITSTISKTFALSDAADAHRFMGARKTTGSIVLVPSL